MEVTESVKNLVRGFHQDMFEYAQTPEAISEEAVGFLGPEDAPSVIRHDERSDRRRSLPSGWLRAAAIHLGDTCGS